MGHGVGDREPSRHGTWVVGLGTERRLRQGTQGRTGEVALGQRLEGKEAASTGYGERSFLGRRKACAKAPRSGCAGSFHRKRGSEREGLPGEIHVEASAQRLISLEKFTLERFEGLFRSTEG